MPRHMFIGDCDCCDARDVPGSIVRVAGEPFACFPCQGHDEPDPYAIREEAAAEAGRAQ